MLLLPEIRWRRRLTTRHEPRRLTVKRYLPWVVARRSSWSQLDSTIVKHGDSGDGAEPGWRRSAERRSLTS